MAALPADARHVRAYILDRAAAGRVDATLRMDAAGIASVHEVHGAALRWADIEAAPDGSGRVTITRSKTDQTAEGRGQGRRPR